MRAFFSASRKPILGALLISAVVFQKVLNKKRKIRPVAYK